MSQIRWDEVITAVGNEKILRVVMETFLDECPKLLDGIEQSLAESDAKSVQRHAHTLKGAMRFFSGIAASETAGEIEEAGRDNKLTEAAERLPKLKLEMEELLPEIRDFVGPQP